MLGITMPLKNRPKRWIRALVAIAVTAIFVASSCVSCSHAAPGSVIAQQKALRLWQVVNVRHLATVRTCYSPGPMVYYALSMGIVVAVIGTVLVWLPRIDQSDTPAWPTVLATVGFWVLGGMLMWLKKR
jgi:hypothetical protein